MSTTRFVFRRGHDQHEVDTFLHGERIEFHGSQAPASFTFTKRGESRIELRTGDRVVEARFHRDRDLLWLHADGRTYCLEVGIPGRTREQSPTAARAEVTAPMTGTVRKVHVVVGSQVQAGEPVVVLEAMKMEYVLRAPRDGVVAELRCVEGQQAEAQLVLLRLEEATS